MTRPANAITSQGSGRKHNGGAPSCCCNELIELVSAGRLSVWPGQERLTHREQGWEKSVTGLVSFPGPSREYRVHAGLASDSHEESGTLKI